MSKVHVFLKRFDEKVLVFLQTQFQDHTYRTFYLCFSLK